MITTLLQLLRLFPFLYGGPRQLALENLALRQQLAVYKRTANRPGLRRGDRLFWVALSRLWRGWRQALVIVAPDTVLRCNEPYVIPPSATIHDGATPMSAARIHSDHSLQTLARCHSFVARSLLIGSR